MCVYYKVDEIEHQHHFKQFQQQQHYTDQATATRLPPSYHQTLVTAGDSNYRGTDAPATASQSVPIMTYRVPPAVQVPVPFGGVQPQMSSALNAQPTAQQSAQPQPFIHVNSLLPGQVNVPLPAAVLTTPGTYLSLSSVT